MIVKANILVVEDDTNVATVLQARLENFGYCVCDIKKSGYQAIAAAAEHQPDLILMDIMLEGDMNGIQAAEQIKKQQDVPIIFLSCRSDQEIMDRAISTEPFGYIVKPYDNNNLRTTIQITLLKHKVGKRREKLICKLKSDLKETRRLNSFLPICSSCKKIRDENQTWQKIERYIGDRLEVDFSHGLCPDCAHQLYPELYNDNKA
ncbi:MAG: response regulator [Desulfobacteraceae bacterium]|nr:response regulator [Desulfobacteraceae bacterium]